VADFTYNSAKTFIANGAIDLDTDTLYILLTTASYTPNQDAHAYRSDVTNELPASGGYVAGGFTITGQAITQDNPNNRAVFDADDWTQALTFTNARWGVLYKRRGGAASADELIRCFDFGSAQSATGSFTLRFGASGIITFED
jgi:hypothetical protein